MRAPTSSSCAGALAALCVCACGPATSNDPTADAPAGGGIDGAGGGDIDARPGGPRVDAPSCATDTFEAMQTPAAMLVVLDRSASMAESNKFVFAAQAIVAALDQDVFDAVHVGLYAAPSGTIAGPACIFGFPVACQAPPFPQVDIMLAGTQKSAAASGVRHDIKAWLTTNGPDDGLGDASPMYNALQAAIGALRLWPGNGKRVLLVVTDGTLSCNEFSSRAGFADCNGCTHDWEDPRNIADLLGTANADADQPVESFVIGVPGADTFDPSACNYPPYHMRLALSAIAYAGAPDYVPPTCDGRTFTPDGGDPTTSCHFDMTTGFSATALADAIATIRGEALGCIFDLPVPPEGGEIDLDRVNVRYTADGTEVSLGRRASTADLCTDVGCWDYTDDGRVELIGEACAAIKGAASVSIRIDVGCETIIL